MGGGGLTPLHRSNRCILQLQPTKFDIYQNKIKLEINDTKLKSIIKINF